MLHELLIEVWQHGKTLLIWIGRRNGTWWHFEPESREPGFLRRLESQERNGQMRGIIRLPLPLFAKFSVFNLFCTADSFFNPCINRKLFFISKFNHFKLTIQKKLIFSFYERPSTLPLVDALLKYPK
jgi:hypothetical protein